MDAAREPAGSDAGSARHARISEVFARVCDLPADQRAPALARECGSDGPLRAAVEALLAAEDRPRRDEWLEHPAAVVVPRAPGGRGGRHPRHRPRRVVVSLGVLVLAGSSAFMLTRAWTGAGVQPPSAAARPPADAAEAQAIEPDLRRQLAASMASAGPVDRTVIEVALALARCLDLQGREEEAAALARSARLLAAEAVPHGDAILADLERLAGRAAPDAPPPADGRPEG